MIAMVGGQGRRGAGSRKALCVYACVCVCVCVCVHAMCVGRVVASVISPLHACCRLAVVVVVSSSSDDQVNLSRVIQNAHLKPTPSLAYPQTSNISLPSQSAYQLAPSLLSSPFSNQRQSPMSNQPPPLDSTQPSHMSLPSPKRKPTRTQTAQLALLKPAPDAHVKPTTII